MKNFRTLSVKFIVLILALQVLNLSVYGCAYKEAVVTNKGNTIIQTNQIDCLAEYIVEEVLDYSNAFPEQNGNHTRNCVKVVKTQIQFFSEYQRIEETCDIELPVDTRKYAHYKNTYDYLYFKEINPPPPKLS
ncbi:hypothetical protein A9P82_04505 [Arachidicoccus ginsenosidimutans]|uniref:hypothetical protein n=1 Tax=Arachidicoccus sp. BS20 TaxID=1850526 RepID=UPI0007F08F9B|nr:hypothetical protein [Arachidicoccus sp. BS20]ANI88612.1 hypothetical protein A9P82_04505 [Arachidicoccus sp. BS20]